eukprot:scaffold5981_cov146-Skeletonema_dohrnii-CCMP3373.AAC.5
MGFMSIVRYEEGNYVDSFEYSTKVAELGDTDGHYQLSKLYRTWRRMRKKKCTICNRLQLPAMSILPPMKGGMIE